MVITRKVIHITLNNFNKLQQEQQREHICTRSYMSKQKPFCGTYRNKQQNCKCETLNKYLINCSLPELIKPGKTIKPSGIVTGKLEGDVLHSNWAFQLYYAVSTSLFSDVY